MAPLLHHVTGAPVYPAVNAVPILRCSHVPKSWWRRWWWKSFSLPGGNCVSWEQRPHFVSLLGFDFCQWNSSEVKGAKKYVGQWGITKTRLRVLRVKPWRFGVWNGFNLPFFVAKGKQTSLTRMTLLTGKRSLCMDLPVGKENIWTENFHPKIKPGSFWARSTKPSHGRQSNFDWKCIPRTRNYYHVWTRRHGKEIADGQ